MAVIRFALYVDLMLLFGLPCFRLYNAREAAALGPWFAWIVRVAAIIALPLAVVEFAELCADMSGLTLATLDRATVDAILWQTAIGTAWLVRLAALGASVAIAIWPGRIGLGRAVALAATGGTALASLAWAGHGAAGDWTRLVADIIHLLAAGIWTGALGCFSFLLARRDKTGERTNDLAGMLSRFAVVGTLTVAAILTSGAVNAWKLVGPEHIADFWSFAYGRVLTIKLLVFAAMLALAGANRLYLTPGLVRSLDGGNHGRPQRLLRRSIALEAALALAVLAIVAYLGMLEPPGAT